MPVLIGLLASAGVVMLLVAVASAVAIPAVPEWCPPSEHDPTPPWRLPAVGRRLERARRRAADHEVPQLLDLLAAASSAGLSAQLSLRRSAETLRGPLGSSLRSAFEAADLGSPWRERLDAVADDLDLSDLRRTMLVLGRTERLGTPLAEATSRLAADVRARRRASATERARTAPVKMLFPLVFLVLPAFLLLTVVPVLLTTVQSIR